MKLTLPILVLLILITACGPSPEQQAAFTATAMTATAAAWTPTPTATNTATSTPTFTPTPTSTPTETPTPTLTPTETATPTPTRDPNRYYASDGRFSILLVDDWTTLDVGYKYLALTGPLSQMSQMILFTSETDPWPLAMYAARVQDDNTQVNPGIKSIREEFLKTSSGIDYFRWVFELERKGMTVRETIYLFENGDWKLTIGYLRESGEYPGLDAVVDQMIDSIELFTSQE